MTKARPEDTHPLLESLRHSVGICACLAVRQTARAITQVYDRQLAPAQLSIGQYSLLTALYYSKSIAMKKLAAKLQMERTSLTRILVPLEREGLVTIENGVEDRRSRFVNLTAAGLERLIVAYPLWERAQQEVTGGLGDVKLQDLRQSLAELSDVTSKSIGPSPS